MKKLRSFVFVNGNLDECSFLNERRAEIAKGTALVNFYNNYVSCNIVAIIAEFKPQRLDRS